MRRFKKDMDEIYEDKPQEKQRAKRNLGGVLWLLFALMTTISFLVLRAALESDLLGVQISGESRMSIYSIFASYALCFVVSAALAGSILGGEKGSVKGLLRVAIVIAAITSLGLMALLGIIIHLSSGGFTLAWQSGDFATVLLGVSAIAIPFLASLITFIGFYFAKKQANKE